MPRRRLSFAVTTTLLVACGPDLSGASSGGAHVEADDVTSAHDDGTSSDDLDTPRDGVAPYDDDEQPSAPMVGFSFVDEHLAGMPLPGIYRPLATDLAGLVDEGIDVLVSLTANPPDPSAIASVGLAHAHFPIVDFQPPTLEQQHAFVALVDEARARRQKVGVHCLAGKGRTGTMLATWFVHEGLSADEAIAHVRALRPGSIETASQEAAVFAYATARDEAAERPHDDETTLAAARTLARRVLDRDDEPSP